MPPAPTTATAPTIVVVNDEEVQLQVLVGILKHAGYQARPFLSAEAALLAMPTAAPPELIVTDLHMPGIDGWRFCRLLKSPDYAALNRIPILVVSATFAGDEPERITAELGAEAFLPSPVDGRRLVGLVQNALSGEHPRHLPKVLIVDDDENLGHLLQEAFDGHGYQCDVARTVQSATAAFPLSPYDVAVVDYHLPDGSGAVLLDSFRARRPECVVLMMTGDSNPALALNWMKRGAAAYLRKPFKLEYLIELCGRARRERTLLRTQDLLQERTRELRKSEGNFHTFFDTVPDLLMVLSPEGKVLRGNRATQTKLGYTSGELSTMHVLELHPSAVRAEAESLFTDMQAGRRNSCPLPLMAKDGTLVPVETRVWSGTWNGAECIFGACRDLTVEQEAQQRFERLFRNNPAPMAISSLPERRFVDVNDRFLSTLGYAKEEVLGRTATELGLFVDPGLQEEVAAKLQAQGRISDIELRVRRRDRRVVEGLFSGEVIYNQGRQYYLTVMVDITERKQLEDRLRQSQKMEAVGQLAGGMAHEFNNILAASMMALTLARTQITDSEAITHLDNVQTLSRRAADLIKQLLAFSRKSVMQREVLDMGTVVAEQCRMMQRLLGERITLEFNGTSPLAVEGDRVLLEQVIWNLCLNARDAMNGEGRLQLNLVSVEIDPRRGNTHNDARPGKHVRVSVTDTGCGMDEQTLKRLFEPFFTTKEVGQGTGLGLATVRGIVQQHQGWIEVESHVGVGTTFRVFLPASHEDIPLRPPMPEGMTGLVNGTLLLVEDEPALRKPTMTLLMRNGYRIIEAGDGEQGLALWEKHRSEIDLIITDMVMPGSVSGLDLAERALADKPGIKVIITSGYHAEVPEAEEVTDSPIIYLPKPWPPETLNLIIQTCLRHAICH